MSKQALWHKLFGTKRLRIVNGNGTRQSYEKSELSMSAGEPSLPYKRETKSYGRKEQCARACSPILEPKKRE